VRGGTKFEFTVEFENLTPQEYALLYFALTLEHKCPDHDGDKAVDLLHKLGYGKGVGLGSCFVRVAEEFESAGQFLGLSETPPERLKCGLETVLKRPWFPDVQAARTKQGAAHLLLYPPKSWFKPKRTIADFDKELIAEPPKVWALHQEPPRPVVLTRPDVLPAKVRMEVTSINNGKIKAKTTELYNGRNYRCEDLKIVWGAPPVSKGMEITVSVKLTTVDHKESTFKGSAWEL
jgi:hypothetical protein